MISQTLINIGWTMSFIIISAVTGTALILVTATIIPRIIYKESLGIDEAKEIVRGNTAVAEYFGRIVAAAIIGVSIIIAASVLGGVIAGLHG